MRCFWRQRALAGAIPALAVWVGAASAGEPFLSVQSFKLAGEGDAFIAGGPLGDSDSFTYSSTDLDLLAGDLAWAFADMCPGCPETILGSASGAVEGLGMSPTLLADQFSLRLSAFLTSAASSSAVSYNSGPPTFQTFPTQVSGSASPSLTFVFDLHRPARTVLTGFLTSSEARKQFSGGTASTSTVLTLADEHGATFARVDTQASATQSGSMVRDDETLSGATFILPAGRYSLTATHANLAGGVASGSTQIEVSAESISSATLDLTPCPVVSKQPESILDAHHGEQVKFAATIDVWIAGDGGRWVWRRNGTELTGNEPGINILFTSLPTSVLFIQSANVAHLGTYDAIWTSHCGAVPTDAAVLAFMPCPPDLTGDYVLDIFDITAFLNAWSARDPIADWVPDGIFDFFDVQAYLLDFARGCH